MKKTRWKIVIFICSVLIVCFLLIYFIFRNVMIFRINANATNGIQTYLDEEYDTEEIPNGYTPSIIYVSSFDSKETSEEENDETSEDEEDDLWDYFFNDDDFYDWLEDDEDSYFSYYTDEEKSIINYIKEQETDENEIIQTYLNGEHIYLAYADSGYGYSVYYINVSGEYQLITLFTIILWSVMVVCIVAAALIGSALGKRIEKDQQKQKEFFENASHDLKTPLMAIQGYAEGLETGVIEDKDKAYHVIMEESERMAHLVDEIMTLSRLESKTVKLNKEDVCLNEVAEDCLMGIEYQAQGKHIEIHLDMEEKQVKADRAQLERAVTNLLSNALRYAEKEIRITLKGNDFTVWNDGAHFSDEEIRDLFERFRTGDKGHTGIGLSLTREIVIKHGWKISAANVGNGVAFNIRIK